MACITAFECSQPQRRCTTSSQQHELPSRPLSTLRCSRSKRKHVACTPLPPMHAPARNLIVRAGEEPTAPPGMSADEALGVLGVRDSDSFEQVLNAKNKLIRKAGDNPDRQDQINTAYDRLLMRSMSRRLQGDVQQTVRFADVIPTPSNLQKAQRLLAKLPGGLKVSRHTNQEAAAQAAVFAGIGAWALIQGLTEPPYVAQRDVPGLQLAIASSVAIFLLRDRKRLTLARAAGIGFLGLVGGAVVGGALQSWLRVDIVPIGSFNSPGIFVGEFALAGLYLAATFLA